jgi:hypothetical protein
MDANITGACNFRLVNGGKPTAHLHAPFHAQLQALGSKTKAELPDHFCRANSP